MKLLQTVRQDLEDVVAITSSGKKQTNHHRSLIATLTKGMIPTSWVGYKVPTSCSVATWVTDFSARVKQLSSVSKAVSGSGASQLKSITVWMGGEWRERVGGHFLIKYFRTVQPRGLHHGHPSVRGTGQLLVTGGAPAGRLCGGRG